jgi:putative transposase
VHAELVPGQQVNRERVAGLLRRAGLQGIYRRKGRKNTRSTPPLRKTWLAASSAPMPGRLWLTGTARAPHGRREAVLPSRHGRPLAPGHRLVDR